MEADKGTIERNGKASIHYLAQTPDFDAESTLLEAVLDGDHPRLQMVKPLKPSVANTVKCKKLVEMMLNCLATIWML